MGGARKRERGKVLVVGVESADAGRKRVEEQIAVEHLNLECKRELDPTVRSDQVKLVREVVAMANTAGGVIQVGVAEDGTHIGIEGSALGNWDAARIGDLLDRFVAPDHVEVRISTDSSECPDGRCVVEMRVKPASNPPLVLARDGNADGDRALFRKHDVLVRHNTKVERARRADFLAWREDLRDRILRQFQMVVEAPETAHLRMVDVDEIRDEPNFLLSRAADLFEHRPEKLLDAADLLYLFEHRAALDLARAQVAQLLIQSSLRRRATLYFWLSLTGVTSAEIEDTLRMALDMQDRDKSDMAGVVPLIAAMYLDDRAYSEIIQRMSTSQYVHIREAAAEYPTPGSARAAVERRRSMLVDGQDLMELHPDELLALADDIVKAESSATISRRMPAVGLELLVQRRGARRPEDPE